MVVTSDVALIAKVVDFGLSTVVEGDKIQRLTRTGEVVGDPRYMSPEQCCGKKLDSRSDVYSFGCLMYEALTGREPFVANDPVAVMQMHLSVEPEPFANRLGLPQNIEDIVFASMAKEPKQRPESFEVLSGLLSEAASKPNERVIVSPYRKQVGRRKTSRFRSFMVGLGVVLVLLIGSAVLFKEQLISFYYESMLSSGANDSKTRLAYLVELANSSRRSNNSLQTYLYLVEAAKLNHILYPDSQQEFLALVDSAHAAGDAGMRKEEAESLEHALTVAGTTNGKGQQIDPSQIEAAARELVKVAPPAQSTKVVLDLARILDAQHQWELADRILRLTPSERTDKLQYAQIALMGGRLKAELNDLPAAKKFFEAAIEAAPDKSSRLLFTFNSAQNLQDSNHFPEALSFYQMCDQLEKASPNSVLRILVERRQGECLAALRQHEQAIPHYQASIAIWETGVFPPDTDYVRALHGLGKSYAAVGNYDKATQTFGHEIFWLQNKLRDKERVGDVQLWEAISSLGDSLYQGKHYSESAGIYQFLSRETKPNVSSEEVAKWKLRQQQALELSGGKFAQWSDIRAHFMDK